MELSEIGKEMLQFQERLANEYHYKPLTQISFLYGNVREKYLKALPSWCKLGGDPNRALYTSTGTQLCSGYNRIVIGDYGAFIEITPEFIRRDVLCCKPGQEYRYNDERFTDKVKYLWLTVNDDSDCKIYFQKKTVSYADYVPGMYYVSPYEVFIEKE